MDRIENKVITDKSYHVFIDLDKTLLAVDSGTELAKRAHKEGLMRTRDLINGLYLVLLYKMEWRDTRKIIHAMALWMKGIEEVIFADFARKVCEESLFHQIRPEFIGIIADHKKAGANIIMLSAALDYVCHPIAEHLGFDAVICSSLETIGGVFSGHPEGNLCFGEEKLRRVEAFYQQHTAKPLDDYCYGDSFSDVYVLRAVGHPVAVDPDRHLRRHARQKGWEIMG